MVVDPSRIVLFDCIEYPDSHFFYIDPIADIAFILSDFLAKNATQYALTLLNCYLETTKDKQGLEILPYYMAHRNLVLLLRMKARKKEDIQCYFLRSSELLSQEHIFFN